MLSIDDQYGKIFQKFIHSGMVFHITVPIDHCYGVTKGCTNSALLYTHKRTVHTFAYSPVFKSIKWF